jgi:Arf-GAP/coiled-coil/ANK repeat/PH domain-containing protein
LAARRGNVGIAEALLDAGADLEASDKKGETPLRRAVNCGHKDLAALFVSRGADPNAPDKKGVTPRDAARNSEMIEILSGNGASA